MRWCRFGSGCLVNQLRMPRLVSLGHPSCKCLKPRLIIKQSVYLNRIQPYQELVNNQIVFLYADVPVANCLSSQDEDFCSRVSLAFCQPTCLLSAPLASQYLLYISSQWNTTRDC